MPLANGQTFTDIENLVEAQRAVLANGTDETCPLIPPTGGLIMGSTPLGELQVHFRVRVSEAGLHRLRGILGGPEGVPYGGIGWNITSSSQFDIREGRCCKGPADLESLARAYDFNSHE